MDGKPLISLVSGTYNRIALLQEMIQSFRDNIPVGLSYEIVICDGGSTDGSLDWLQSQPDIVLIEHGELRGAIKAFTEAAYLAKGKYVILANDDIAFGAGSVMRAFVHLEENPHVGAVAFADNRPIPPYLDHTTFKTLPMPAQVKGRPDTITYAQVGMFHKWLGDRVGWWLGVNREMHQSRTYGGDNFLSAKIWELGYRVDPVKDCYVVDHVVEDELRQINRAAGKIANADDSGVYYRLWSKAIGGPIVPDKPTTPQESTPAVRVMYFPIYEPGWAVQKQQKRGLRDALARYTTPKGWKLAVHEIDYLAIPSEKFDQTILEAVRTFKPNIILTQIQAPRPFTPALLQQIRDSLPRVLIINWNGDYWPDGLVSHAMLNILRHVDLQLTVNGSVLDRYKQEGITAAYWQIGFEDDHHGTPKYDAKHDVVFLANAYSDERANLIRDVFRRDLESINIGLYGSGWGDFNSGECLYDFASGAALYRNAKIALGDNQYPDAYGFVSNRLFQALAAGGAMLLHQHVPGLKELTNLLPGTHYVEWSDVDDLKAQLRYFLDPAHEADRARIARAGTEFVRHFHSFDARVGELFELIKKHLKPYQAPEGNSIYLRYIGPLDEGFGIPSSVHERIKYQYEPGQPLLVDKLDAPFFLSQTGKGSSRLWEVVTE